MWPSCYDCQVGCQKASPQVDCLLNGISHDSVRDLRFNIIAFAGLPAVIPTDRFQPSVPQHGIAPRFEIPLRGETVYHHPDVAGSIINHVMAATASKPD